MGAKGVCAKCGKPTAHYQGYYSQVSKRGMLSNNPVLRDSRKVVWSTTLCDECGEKFVKVCRRWKEGCG